MVDERTPSSSEPPKKQNGINNGTFRNQHFQRRIAHETTATITNNRYTTIYTVEICHTKDSFTITTPTVDHYIFDAIKWINISAVTIFFDQVHISHNKDIPSGDKYKKTFKDCRTCDITKRI